MEQKIKVRFKGYDDKLLDKTISEIVHTVKRTGAEIVGPIPLPTRRIVVPCRKSPDGEGSETWDRWEMRVHKRLLELVTNSAKDERSLRKVLRIPIPDSVTIELSLRNMG